MFGFLKSATDKIAEAAAAKIEDLDFETREEYRAWRKEWFAEYKAAIKAVRDAKLGKKQVQREGSKQDLSAYETFAKHCRAMSDVGQTYGKAISRVDSLVSTRFRSRVRAGELRAKRLEMAAA